MSERSISGVPTVQLGTLVRLVESRSLVPPLTATALQACGLDECWPRLSWLAAFDADAVLAICRVALDERRGRPSTGVELVWTGPEPKVSKARDTAVVVRELFARAERSVLVAGFTFTGGEQIFAPLYSRMRDLAVQTRLILHLDDAPGVQPLVAAQRGIEAFLRENWPFGQPTPAIYYDPRTVAPGATINLHAKCVVVDDRYVLIGSANFTHNAHARNIEVGVLVDDARLASDLLWQWQGLIDEKLLVLADEQR